MSTATPTRTAKLTPYEAKQVRRIAAWKSHPPNPLSELWKRILMPVAHVVERLIPDALVRSAIEKAYDASSLIAVQEGIERRAGVRELDELKHVPMKECDALAERVELASESIAAVEGAATGAGGVVTTLLDIPILFVLSLGTIRKIGHCYGYALDRPNDRPFVLGVMIAAIAGSLEVRRRRLDQLREIEELLIVEYQEDLVTEELLSLLFQLEIFEEIPGVGTVSGAVLNWAFMRRVGETARMVFQERWLKDNGKVHEIAPAEVHPLHLATGWSGALSRVAYSGCYYLGFGMTLPVYTTASLLRPMDNALVRGLRDGASAATEQAEKAVAWTRGAALPSVNGACRCSGDGSGVRSTTWPGPRIAARTGKIWCR